MDKIKLEFIKRIKYHSYLFKVNEDVYYIIYAPVLADYDLYLFTYELQQNDSDYYTHHVLSVIDSDKICMNIYCTIARIDKEEMFNIMLVDTT